MNIESLIERIDKWPMTYEQKEWYKSYVKNYNVSIRGFCEFEKYLMPGSPAGNSFHERMTGTI